MAQWCHTFINTLVSTCHQLHIPMCWSGIFSRWSKSPNSYCNQHICLLPWSQLSILSRTVAEWTHRCHTGTWKLLWARIFKALASYCRPLRWVKLYSLWGSTSGRGVVKCYFTATIVAPGTSSVSIKYRNFPTSFHVWERKPSFVICKPSRLDLAPRERSCMRILMDTTSCEPKRSSALFRRLTLAGCVSPWRAGAFIRKDCCES